MKKLLSLAVGALLLGGLVACGGKPNPTPSKPVTPTPSKPSEDPLDKVLSGESEGYNFHFTGQTVGLDSQGGGAWGAHAENKMTPASINQVKKINAEVGAKLAGKNVKYLYVKEGIELGVVDGGWTTNCKINGEIKVANASYAIKFIRSLYEAEDDVYTSDQWISDPKTAHVEALNGNIFYPTWQEEADEEGFAWDQNPVCIGGAGVYTAVVAQYKEVSSAEVFGFGVALIKTAEKEGQPYEDKFEFDHYKLVGSINGWNANDADEKLVLGENGVNYHFEADDEFQVIQSEADGKGTWSGQMGASAVAESPEGAFDLTGGNIKCVVAGDYNVSVKSGEVYIKALLA